MFQLHDPEGFWTSLGVIAGMAFVVVLVGVHVRQRTPQERIEEEAVLIAEVVPELPPLVPLKSAAEVAEVADKTQWLATMAEAMTAPDDLTGGRLNLERPAGEVLCDRPELPPRNSELWLTIRLATMRRRPLSWRRLDTAIGEEWAGLVATRAKALEATQEITPEMRAKVLGGVE